MGLHIGKEEGAGIGSIERGDIDDPRGLPVAEIGRGLATGIALAVGGGTALRSIWAQRSPGLTRDPIDRTLGQAPDGRFLGDEVAGRRCHRVDRSSWT